VLHITTLLSKKKHQQRPKEHSTIDTCIPLYIRLWIISHKIYRFRVFNATFNNISVILLYFDIYLKEVPSWSYGSWIYSYLCNQCLSPLRLWVRIPLRRGVLDTTLCDKVFQCLATGRWFSLVFSTNKTDRRDITEILLKVALNTRDSISMFTWKVTFGSFHCMLR
jgi:hypothetical protein